MKSPVNPNDPLLQALAEDEQALSRKVAAEVRSRRQNRRNIIRVAMAGMLLATFWLGFDKVFTHRGPSVPMQVTKDDTIAAPSNRSFGNAFAKEYPAESLSDDDLTRPAATEEERKLLRDLRDAPSLIVWNDAGRISCVHVFDKSSE
jgi:hypothetical protein